VARDLWLVQTVLNTGFMCWRRERVFYESLEMRELEAEEGGGHEAEDEDDER